MRAFRLSIFLIVAAVSSLLYVVLSPSPSQAASVVFQYTDSSHKTISVKGGPFDTYKGALKQDHKFIDGAGRDGGKVFRSHPDLTISNYPGQCITSITIPNGQQSGVLRLLECNNAPNQSDIENQIKLNSSSAITINKSNEELRAEEMTRDRLAYTEALRSNKDATNAFCANMSDKSECSNDIGARFTQCFNGQTSDNSFVYPNYDISGLAGCMAGDNRTNAAIYRNALAQVDNQVRQDNQEPVVDSNIGNAEVNNDNKSSCVVDGIGWIVCPVLNFLSGIVDGAYGFVAGLLTVQPLVTTGQNAGVYDAWLVMRNIANIAFVIVFLIIIFSQLSSVGISNYGVKKMLPRLVVAAILVNVSFLICAIAVDISNVLGTSIKNVFDSIGASIKPVDLTDPVWSTGKGWEGMTAVVLAGAAGISLYVGLSALIPAVLAAFVAIATVFIVLTLRQALIILLITIAPLAFVAYLLPNTEEWFTKWRKLFMTLLLMFPIIAGIFGASALASQIVMNGAHETSIAIPIQIMGALISILPLAITPVVMKAAGGVLNRFAGMVNNANKGPIDRLRRGSEGYRKNRQEFRKLKSLNGGRSLPGMAAFSRRNARKQAVLNNRQAEMKRSTAEYISDKAENSERFRNQLSNGGGAGANQRALDQALNIKASIEAEEVKAATNRIERVVLNEQELRDISLGRSRKGVDGADMATRKAAYQQLGARGDFQGMNEAWDNVRMSNNQELRRAFADSMAGSSNRPGWMGAGALQSLRETDTATGLSKAHSTSSTNLVENAIKSNVYSAEKQVGTDKEELRIVAEVNHSSTSLSNPEKQKLIDNAALAQTDTKLRTQIGKNAEAIDSIRQNKIYPKP